MSGPQTAALEEPGFSAEEPTRTSLISRFTPFIPAVVAVLGAWAALHFTHTPYMSIIIYTLYFAVAVMLPGTLLYRRVAGFAESQLSDVAWGSVVGLMLELAGWAIFTAAGINRYLWTWPALVLVTFAAVPSLRAMWRRPVGSARTSPVAAWGTAIASLLGWASMAVSYYPSNNLPPSGRGYFVDLPWHLGVAYEATRSVVPTTPEASAEGILHYHWFGDAHFAAASLISGVNLPTVVIRTGLFPLVFIIAASTVALAVKITGRPLAAAISGVLVIGTTAGAEYWTRLYKMYVIDPESPTGMYSVGVSCLVFALLIDLLRGKRLSKGSWALFGVASFFAPGTKPSILLLFIPALCLVLAVGLVRRQPLNRPVLVALGLMIVSLAVSVFVFASPGGSGIAPSLVQVRVWIGTSGISTPVPVMVVTALVKGYLLFFVAGVALLSARLRSDPAARLLGAVPLVGAVAAWVISHPGLSQFFFWDSAIPFAAVVSAWGLVLAWDALAERRRAVIAFVVVSLAAILVSMVVVRLVTNSRARVRPGWVGLIVAVLVILLAALVLRMAPRVTILTAAVAAMVLSVPVTLIVAPRQPKPPQSTLRALDEIQAAQWVQAHTPLRDEVATNSHCLGPTVAHCDARSFWLAGFGGRQVLLEGFGVSPNALRRDLVDGYKAWRQPYHDQALQQLNDGAFMAPTAPNLLRLYDEYGVRWLVADRAAGPVSPTLDNLATFVYGNDWVRVYKLDPTLIGAPAR